MNELGYGGIDRSPEWQQPSDSGNADAKAAFPSTAESGADDPACTDEKLKGSYIAPDDLDDAPAQEQRAAARGDQEVVQERQQQRAAARGRRQQEAALRKRWVVSELGSGGMDRPREELEQLEKPVTIGEIMFPGDADRVSHETSDEIHAGLLGRSILPEETGPGAYQLPDSAEIIIEIREKVKSAVAEYAADELEDEFLDKLWDLWSAPAGDGIAKVAEGVGSLDKNIHLFVIFDPSEKILSGFDFPEANLLSSILQEAPIDSVDVPLGQLKQWIEVSGIVIGLIWGHAALAGACFKDLMRDVAHKIIASEIKSALSDNDSKIPNTAEPVPGGRTGSHPDGPATLKEETAVGRVTNPTQEQGTAAQEDQKVAQEQQQQETAARGRWQQEVALERQEQAVTPVRDRGARVLGDAAATKSLVRDLAMEIQEGREHLTSGGLHPGSIVSSSAWSSPISDRREFTFVHLRIHYGTVEPESAADDLAKPVRVTRLVVEHESSALAKVCYLWEARSEGTVTLDSPTANALRNDLRRTLAGGPLDLGSLNPIIQKIPNNSVDQFLNGTMGCIEVISVLAGAMSERPTLACVGFKTLRHDGFFRIVVAAINELNTSNRH